MTVISVEIVGRYVGLTWELVLVRSVSLEIPSMDRELTKLQAGYCFIL